MDKRLIIEYLKTITEIQFNESIEGDEIIGYIQDHSRLVAVSFLQDNLGEYLKLSFITEYVGTLDINKEYLTRLFINGRHKISNNAVELFSIIPILKETYLNKQIMHALLEIWDMNNVVQSTLKQ